jgi:TolB-like protein
MKCKYHANFFILLIMAHAIFAINNVAVLELLPNASVQEMISIEEGRHLTDELRRQAVMNLPKSDYSVLTRDNIIALLPPDEEEAECLAEGCAVDIGRAIGAEYISQGTIGKFGNKLTISVELYETMGGKLLSSIVFESENIEGLLGAIRNEAKPLFQNILELKTLSEPRYPRLENLQDTSHIYLQSGESNTLHRSQLFREHPQDGYPVNRGSDKGSMRLPQWVGVGLAVAGIGAGIYGIFQNSEYERLHSEYMKTEIPSEAESLRKKAEGAESRRKIGYTVGSALLASGITIYFVF